MNKKLLAIIGLFLLSIIVSWNLLKPGFFSIHDDLQVMRLYEMKRCLNDGQIPCRWSPDMGAGYGQPMFNYYSATPYYTGAIFNSLGVSFIDATKIIFFISIALSGIAMFLFLSEYVSSIPALLGGAAYILVPFRAFEVFVRGALAENFALALLPLVLYGIIRLTKRQTRHNIVLLAIFSGLFLATHNITSLISVPLILIFSVALILQAKNKTKLLKHLFFSAVLGLGLSAFFILPVLFEGNLINTSFLTSGYFDFRAHFVSLNQLFINQSWGFGSSEFGPNDKLSFAVGVVQTLALVTAPLIIFIKKKNLNKNLKTILGLFWLVGILFLFFTTNRSIFGWEIFALMRYIQFPWRLLGIVAVCTSALIAFVTNSISKKFQRTFSIIILVTLFVLNFRYFKFESQNPQATDSTYLTGEIFNIQQQSAFLDYRPLSVVGIPERVAPLTPVVLSGLAEVKNFQKRSSYFSADVEVFAGQAKISFPISYFPNWTVYLNSSIHPTSFETGKEFGEITMTFDKGITLVQGYFENTPIRTAANAVTFISLLLVLVIVTFPNEKKHNQ